MATSPDGHDLSDQQRRPSPCTWSYRGGGFSWVLSGRCRLGQAASPGWPCQYSWEDRDRQGSGQSHGSLECVSSKGMDSRLPVIPVVLFMHADVLSNSRVVEDKKLVLPGKKSILVSLEVQLFIQQHIQNLHYCAGMYIIISG